MGPISVVRGFHFSMDFFSSSCTTLESPRMTSTEEKIARTSFIVIIGAGRVRMGQGRGSEKGPSVLVLSVRGLRNSSTMISSLDR